MTVGGPWSRQRVELDVAGLSIAAGQSHKWFPNIVFGAIDEFDNNEDNGSLTTLGPQGDPVTQVYPYQDTPFDLEVVSDSADDDEIGIGGRRMLVQGLDEDWFLREVFLTLDGATEVVVPDPAPGKQWLRVLALRITVCGSNGINVGTITAQIPGGVPPIRMANIMPRAGHDIMALTTIPADFVGFIKKWQLVAMPEGGIEGGGTGQVPQFVGALMLRDNDPDYFIDPEAGDQPPFYTADVSAGEERDVIVPALLPPKTDVELRLLNVDLNNAAIAGNFQLVARRLTEEEQNGTARLKEWIRQSRVFF